MKIPVASRSKAWVCGRSPAVIAVSNPARGMDVCLLRVLCVVGLEVPAKGRSLVQRSPTDCLCVCVYVIECNQVQQLPFTPAMNR